MYAAAKRQDAAHRVFAAGEKVAAIDTSADPRIAIIHRPDDAVELVVQRTGTVVVDRDADGILRDELAQAVEGFGVGLRIGGNRANAELAREFKNAPIRSVVWREAIDALSGDCQAGVGSELAGGSDLLVARR